MRNLTMTLIRTTLLLVWVFAAISCTKESENNTLPAKDTADNSLKAGSLTTVSFAGYTWNVKNATGMGPGYNNWSPANVSVVNGKLQLTLTFNEYLRKWDCAEVWTTKNLGYGTYEWVVESPIDNLHPNVVLGLFNYLPTPVQGGKKTAEIDIEFSKWGRADNTNNAGFSVWPNKTYLEYFTSPYLFQYGDAGTVSTHSFTWSSRTVSFKSTNANGDTMSIVYSPQVTPTYYIPQLAQPVHMNLWVFGTAEGQTGPNTNVSGAAATTVIIRSFRFIKGR